MHKGHPWAYNLTQIMDDQEFTHISNKDMCKVCQRTTKSWNWSFFEIVSMKSLLVGHLEA